VYVPLIGQACEPKIAGEISHLLGHLQRPIPQSIAARNVLILLYAWCQKVKWCVQAILDCGRQLTNSCRLRKARARGMACESRKDCTTPTLPVAKFPSLSSIWAGEPCGRLLLYSVFFLSAVPARAHFVFPNAGRITEFLRRRLLRTSAAAAAARIRQSHNTGTRDGARISSRRIVLKVVDSLVLGQ